ATKLLHNQLIVLLIFKHVQDPEVNLDDYESLVFKMQKLFWAIKQLFLGNNMILGAHFKIRKKPKC
ncbi:MAG: hypothetical protein DI529_17790, partial [Chryseobacterium sp.]